MPVKSADEHAAGYESFFGLREAPFGLVPNTRFRFESASHHAALTQLTYALQRREPVVVVTGHMGTGKTLLCRTVIERLDRKTFLSIINDPRVGREDLLKQMLQDFGIISKDRTKASTASRTELVHALDEFLLSLTPLGAHAVVVIDEAQHAQADLLEEIRLLSNIQDERLTMLQIILVGQPDLETLLATPELQALRQRVSRHVRLEPLSAGEVAKYVAHRLDVAREGATPSRLLGAKELERALAEWQAPAPPPTVTFTADALTRIAQLANGIPRVVNLLCDRALEAAYGAERQSIDAPMVEVAARALDMAVGSAEPVEPQPLPDVVWVDQAVDPAALHPGPIGVPGPLAGGTRARRGGGLRGLSLAAAVAAILGAVWFGARAWKTERPVQPTSPATPATTNQAPPAPPRVVSSPETPTPAPATPRPAAPETPSPPVASPAAGGGFEVIVASFRTAARANAVASEVSALGQPVRQTSAAGWEQVLAGPFASRAQAEEAQQQLSRAGFNGTIIQERR